MPLSCIQLRNLVLSAFPRNMRLPDPFTPNLKVFLAHFSCVVTLGTSMHCSALTHPGTVRFVSLIWVNRWICCLKSTCLLEYFPTFNWYAPSTPHSYFETQAFEDSNHLLDATNSYLTTRASTSYLSDLKKLLLLSPNDVYTTGSSSPLFPLTTHRNQVQRSPPECTRSPYRHLRRAACPVQRLYHHSCYSRCSHGYISAPSDRL